MKGFSAIHTGALKAIFCAHFFALNILPDS